MTDADDVLAAAQARADALAEGDASALAELLHDDFTWTTHRGQVFDKAAYVRRNTDGTTAWLGQQLAAPVVNVVGDVAVLHALVADRVTASDDGVDVFRMPMTQTWVRSGDRWRCLAGHAGPRLGVPGVPPAGVFVVVTGLAAAGKSTLGRALATELRLPLWDKDGILEDLFDHLGSPDLQARERHSRAADQILFRQAAESPGGVLVNWWDRERAPAALGALGGILVEVLCDVPWQVARDRWASRARHPGHHDHLRPWRFEQRYPPLLEGDPIVVDTSGPVDLDAVVRGVRERVLSA